MTIPAFLFGMLIATVLGTAFHLWRDGGLGRLIFYTVLSWLGFWVGHMIGNRVGWNFWLVGPIQMGTALLGALLFLGVGYWLGLVKVEKGDK